MDNTGNWRKNFNIFDHLGNVRAVMQEKSDTIPFDIIGQYDYYPFGERIDVLDNMDRIGFIGKEKDAESNLGDFGVRKYEDFSGRFTSPDPLWEKYYGWSLYHYCRNNPVSFVDGNGMADYYDNKGNFLGNDGSKEETKYLTTKDEFNKINGSKEKNWTTIQGNKAPTIETIKKMNEIIGKSIDRTTTEFGLIQDKDGIPSEIIKGEPNTHLVDFSPTLNQLIKNGSSPDIMIHSHTTKGMLSWNSPTLDGDISGFTDLNNQLNNKSLPQTSNSIMINSLNNACFYNGNGPTLTIYFYDLLKIYK